MTTRVHAFSDDPLGDLDAVGLAEHLGAGKVSAKEVVEAAISRIEKVAGELNPMAFTAYDRARVDAATPGDAFFAGVPTLVKDNVDVVGMPTMSGTDAWVPRPAKKDGDFAQMYLATGLIPLGKSQLSEYGFSASAEHPRLGAVRTPWNTDHTAGASSAGSGALVAAGAVPIAHANDGGGSIRIPASVNGLVGLKPTRGRLAQDKIMREMPIRIVADGVLTRTVRDTAAFYREAERVHRNLALPPIGDLTRPIKRRLRIALNTSGVGRGADPETRALTEKTAAMLEDLGHTVTETEVPIGPGFADDFLLYWALLAQAMLTTGRPMHGRSWSKAKHDNLTIGLARHARRNIHRVPGAITRLKRANAHAELFHEKYDVSLTPTLGCSTPPVGHLDPTQSYDVVIDKLMDWVAFTPWQNVTGAPAISLPLATAANGLPQGMMFGAAPGQESLLIELAYELEQACPFARITA
ncbi:MULTISPECIES: amidase [unclassified Nocardioides]|uniref:amidase n=1 Tax=unclassified Nocardioides TaxID=2615069 RepID=UPI0006F8C0CB|nr:MULTISPECIES: amidase [unclassified Nocardioides]KRA30867.1 amidase [Nocardioides sp. Root614]KRA87487.1 amidase [Nocardioides sp. Root682]